MDALGRRQHIAPIVCRFNNGQTPQIILGEAGRPYRAYQITCWVGVRLGIETPEPTVLFAHTKQAKLVAGNDAFRMARHGQFACEVQG